MRRRGRPLLADARLSQRESEVNPSLIHFTFPANVTRLALLVVSLCSRSEQRPWLILVFVFVAVGMQRVVGIEEEIGQAQRHAVAAERSLLAFGQRL